MDGDAGGVPLAPDGFRGESPVKREPEIRPAGPWTTTPAWNSSALPPVLVRVRCCVSLFPVKSVDVRLAGLTLATGGTRPAPVSSTVTSGVSGSSLRTLNVLTKVVALVGVKL